MRPSGLQSNTSAFTCLFPFLIIRTLSRANLGSVPIIDFMIVLVVAILGMAAILILIQAFVWKRYPQSGPSFSSVFQGATRFHGFVAIAVIGPLYGDDGVTLAALALAIMVPLLNVISVIVLSVYGRSDSKPEVAVVLTKIATNPLIIACGIGCCSITLAYRISSSTPSISSVQAGLGSPCWRLARA